MKKVSVAFQSNAVAAMQRRRWNEDRAGTERLEALAAEAWELYGSGQEGKK